MGNPFPLQQHHPLADMLSGMPRGALQQLVQALVAVIGREQAGRVRVAVGPPVAETRLNAGTVGGDLRHAGIGRRLLAECPLHEGRPLLGVEESGDHPEEMEGEGAVAARAAGHVNVKFIVRHQRQECDGCGHEPVEPSVEFRR